MPTTQYYTATTLDGFIADPEHSLGWLFEVERSPGGGERWSDFFGKVGAMAMGASTYRWILAHENLIEEPERWRRFYGDLPAWVFTNGTPPEIPGANITFVRGGIAPVHEEMSRAAGERNIWLIGGGDLVGQFADAELLDEIIVGVAPVTLGAGMPLLPRRLTAKDLELVEVARDGQFAYLTYRLRKRKT